MSYFCESCTLVLEINPSAWDLKHWHINAKRGAFKYQYFDEHKHPLWYHLSAKQSKVSLLALELNPSAWDCLVHNTCRMSLALMMPWLIILSGTFMQNYQVIYRVCEQWYEGVTTGYTQSTCNHGISCIHMIILHVLHKGGVGDI